MRLRDKLGGKRVYELSTRVVREKGGVIWPASSLLLSNQLDAKEPPVERRHSGVAKLARIINCKATLYLVVLYCTGVRHLVMVQGRGS